MERVKLLSLLLTLLLFCAPLTRAHADKDNPKVADWSGGYFSAFYLIEGAPQGFKEFDSIAVEYLSKQKDDEKLLLPDQHGNIPTRGKLITKTQTSYRFKKSRLIEGGRSIKLRFITERVDRISYQFDGEYLRDAKEIRNGDLIIGYIHLEGILTRYKDGHKVAQTRLGLTPHWIE